MRVSWFYVFQFAQFFCWKIIKIYRFVDGWYGLYLPLPASFYHHLIDVVCGAIDPLTAGAAYIWVFILN